MHDRMTRVIARLPGSQTDAKKPIVMRYTYYVDLTPQITHL